jgi:hypothetical protein
VIAITEILRSQVCDNAPRLNLKPQAALAIFQEADGWWGYQLCVGGKEELKGVGCATRDDAVLNMLGMMHVLREQGYHVIIDQSDGKDPTVSLAQAAATSEEVV